jgi:NADH dehydrogenase
MTFESRVNNVMMSKKRIVIIGGGFGGVKCAKTLSRELSNSSYEIVLFNSENHLVFSPLLAEVVGSSLNPMDVVAPLRQMLPGVLCLTEDVESVDLAKQEIEYEEDGGQTVRLHYDQLVIACGNISNLGVLPGMADHAFPLKTVGDAFVLRSHVMQQLEKAEASNEPERKRWYLSFIVVGGGYSGVEAAGEINDLVRDSVCFFKNIREDDISVTLIHSQDQILPEIGPKLREFARSKMEKAGVKIKLRCRAQQVTPDGVALEDGSFVSGATIVCTIGTTMSPVVEDLQAPKDRGRLETEPDMRLFGYTNVWAVGDCAKIINSYDGNLSPPTGQFAERQGRQVAENIVRILNSQPTKPFHFKLIGQLCSIGGHTAVAEFFGFHISGFLAWFVWRGVYLFKLPTWSRRIRVGFDWAWTTIFPRDLSHVKAKVTDRITRAHYKAGDFVFRKGDPATNFYVIEKGEAEVVLTGAENQNEEIVAVLGPGSFFGERALVNHKPHQASIRARTSLDIVVMGRNVFTQISKSLTVFRNALIDTLNRRKLDIWQDRPEAHDILLRTPLEQFVDPPLQPLLKTTYTFREVSRIFSESGNEFFYISSDGEHLEGVVTFTDLVRAISSGANKDTPLTQFMTKDPVAISLEDSSLVAAATLRDYKIKWIPVVDNKRSRRIVGCISARKIMAYILKETSTS